MNHIDVFNGDADGICALHQLRLAKPLDSSLVTGVKRDISLLKKVQAKSGDQIVVLDISLDKNRNELIRLLDGGCEVDYIDHHFPGEIPEHSNLRVGIDTDAAVCTSLLVNQRLGNRYPLWAAVGAYGDNLHASASAVIKHLSFDDEHLELLCKLGMYLNYNGYGAELSDLAFSPDELYLKLKPYENPFDFIDQEPVFHQLQEGYLHDMLNAESVEAELEEENVALYILPNMPWARRVMGVYSNQLVRNYPARAHAIFTQLDDGGYQVSVRAPLNKKEGADELCCAFSSGGGRKAAAGINYLSKSDVVLFLDKFKRAFPASH